MTMIVEYRKTKEVNMKPVTFSDAAITHIKSMLAKNPQGVGFRLSVKKTGCSGLAYVATIIETSLATDIHFTAQQELPVFIDPDALQYIQDVTVDFVMEEGHGLKQKHLVFINPQEKSRCGCGESFTIE
jgi:iron-sulfur cluster assembly protein